MAATKIHSTSVVSPQAEIGDGVVIGPYCVIHDGVKLGKGCYLHSHVVIAGPTEIGEENEFYPFCSIGGRTQDLKYQEEPTYLKIGEKNCFREFVTINRGTVPGGRTVVGSFNNLLAYAHIAHDCVVGNYCIFSNNGTLAGHVIMEDYAIVGGLSAVHQFCRLGKLSIVGGCAKIVQDVPPFMIADGNPAVIRSINTVGLQRQGVGESIQQDLKQAFKWLYGGSYNTTQALDKIENEIQASEEIKHLLHFIRHSQRGIIR
ncbi:MAG: acyl-ACP--UDP-N-acetylglucosamine O-acyltransferase [Verrucomicrobiia bacterium]